MLEEADPACDSLMRSIYGLGSTTLPLRTEGKYYCRALACIPDAFGISSTELGVLEGTQGYCDSSGSIGQPGSTLNTPAGNVGPLANDVTQQTGLSTTVSEIKAAMSAGNFGNARSIYNSDSYLTGERGWALMASCGCVLLWRGEQFGGHTDPMPSMFMKISAPVAIQGLAQGNGLSGSIFTKFSSYFGGNDFNAQYVMKAAGLQLSRCLLQCAGSPTKIYLPILQCQGFNEPNAAAKGDMVEKTIQDAIPVQAIWSLTAGNNAADWERAAALYIGAESGDAPYGRANLRAGNFGTTATANGEATANVNIVAAFNGAPSATKRATIEKNLKITYAQATLRYAFFIDNALAASNGNITGAFEYRAEGDAFYRIIAPFVEEVDAGCDAFVSAVMSVDAGTSFPSGA
eukprot:362770-Chlamydomonas_euryale.AAC.1